MALKSLKGVASLNSEQVKELRDAAVRARINAITMVQAANSGHPGGAFSGIEIFLSVYTFANLAPQNCNDLNRDNIIISHGHVSAGVYSVLAELGFFDAHEAVENFRKIGGTFEGHIVRDIPGIDWSTGNLGQGLSAGVGYALAQRARNYCGHVFVIMGDGAQTKGQLAESRRIAVKEGLNNITALADMNDIQICGDTQEIMPCNVKELWEADGWEVLECDGHSFYELFENLNRAVKSAKPVVILCRTLIGKDGGAMEGTAEYHGKATGEKIYYEIIDALGGDKNYLDEIMNIRKNTPAKYSGRKFGPITPSLEMGERFFYGPDVKTGNRNAFGKVLEQIGRLNYKKPGRTPILVFDCDLSPSVQTHKFAAACPDNFFQCGIQEHATATISGAASAGGVISLWADFGVFGIDEVYNQHRLNDINNAGNKLVLTHTGLDVGEDGATHQCIDYVGLMHNMYGWKLVVPADPNQTDCVTRWLLQTPGCICLAMGRSKTDSLEYFADSNYKFEYGRAEKLRNGNDAAVFALGYMASTALKAAKELEHYGINISVYSVCCPLEPDMNAIREACKTGKILALEDHNVNTGMGAIMGLAMLREGLCAKFSMLGVSRYGASGPADDVRSAMGLDINGVVKAVRDMQ